MIVKTMAVLPHRASHRWAVDIEHLSIQMAGNLSFVWEFHGEFHGESPGFDLRCRNFGDFHVEKLQKDLKRINFDKKAATHGS